jgi:transposase
MNGARFVDDRLERLGREVEADGAVKVKGLAPLVCKTDRIDAWVLAELSRRDLVPAIWLPSYERRRERGRWRLFLVRKRTALKNRVHVQLLAFGHPCPVSDLFGRRGRVLLEQLAFPEPWRTNVVAAAAMIEPLDQEVATIEKELRELWRPPPVSAVAADRARDRLDAQLHDRGRNRRHPPLQLPDQATGYIGLRPHVHQSSNTDRRGHLSHAGPRYPRWARVEAAWRQGRPDRRPRHISDAICHTLTRSEPFAPASAKDTLAAWADPL